MSIPQSDTGPTQANSKANSAWIALLTTYLLIALLLSIVQPLGRTPDEPAHMQYVKFLANELRFPVWQTQGGGEAGYEAQHPPLYYVLAAVVYKACSPFTENWRWQILRWATISIGVGLFWVCRRFFQAAFENERLAWLATATVMLMPLTVLYTGYINPDGLIMLLTTTVLFLSWRAVTSTASSMEFVLLGLVCGLALLTKLSGAPAICVALWAAWSAGSHEHDASVSNRQRLQHALIVVTVVMLTCGWWYLRNVFLYGTPFIHTEGQYSSGLGLAAREGFASAMWLTWRETFLSTWVQRGWFPAGFIEYLLYGIIIVMLMIALVGWFQNRYSGDDKKLRFAAKMSLGLILLIFAGQQLAFWTEDVEFNAGGRYMLAAMSGIALLLVGGVAACRLITRYPALRSAIFTIWIAALLVMNIVSAWNIDTVLNPRYAPNWEPFQFVPGDNP